MGFGVVVIPGIYHCVCVDDDFFGGFVREPLFGAEGLVFP